jgi:hypothetical protein
MTKLLSSCRYERKPRGKWPFVTTGDLRYNLGLGLKGSHTFCDGEKSIGRLEDDILTIYTGYASDGASPGFIIPFFGWRFGPPSPKSSAPGFFLHDFLYQFGGLPCCPWTYEQADDAFEALLIAHGFSLPRSYHSAVTIFGGIARRLSKVSTTLYCYTHKLNP